MTDPKDRGPDSTPAVAAGATYDAFLSHNSDDKPAVLELARGLRDAGLEPFLDAWHLVPGEPWQEALEAAIDASRTCVVFVGPAGFGTWENEEMRAALSRRVGNPEFRVIPAILPGAVLPDRGRLPRFLSRLTWVDFRSGLDDAAAFDRLVDGIRGVAPDALDESELGDAPIICPFRGLEVFDEDHADYFFGREALTQYLVEQLRSDRFLAVVGASGSGKSSVVRAGLVPQVRGGALQDSAAWPVVIVRPGAHPMEALASRLGVVLQPGTDALAARQSILGLLRENERGLHAVIETTVAAQDPDWRVLIVVDQFEEVFTLCHDDAEREAFVDTLLHASSVVGGQTVVVVTMRADFFGRCATLPVLAARLAERDVLVPPMEEEDLRRCIVEPAEKVGLQYEKGLIDTILEELGKEPGSLPLLEHTLLELFEGRRGRWMTIDRYREIGGVQGAIAKRAETVYANFTPEQQKAARRVLMRLTEPGEGTEDTRRRAAVHELMPSAASSEAVDEVVRQLADARLLVTSETDSGDEVVDVAHEALIRGWPRLQGWINENPAGLRIQRKITETAIEWEAAKRDPSYLFTGQRLTDAQRWAAESGEDLNDIERAFLTASEAARTREADARRRRTRLAVAGTVVAFVTVAAAAIFAAVNWRQADLNGKAAEAQINLAFGQQLAADDPMHGLAVTMDALGQAHGTPASIVQFWLAAEAQLDLGRYAALGVGVEQVFPSPDGQYLVVDYAGGPGFVASAQTGRPIAALSGEVEDVRFAGQTAAGVVAVRYAGTAPETGTAELRRLPDWSTVPLSSNEFAEIDISPDPDVNVVIVAYGQTSGSDTVMSPPTIPATLAVARIGAQPPRVTATEPAAKRPVELRSVRDGTLLRAFPSDVNGAWFMDTPRGPVVGVSFAQGDDVAFLSAIDGSDIARTSANEAEFVGPQGDRLVVLLGHSCALWDWRTNKVLGSVIPQCQRYEASPDQSLIAFLTRSGGVLNRIADGTQLRTLPEGTDNILFSPQDGAPRMVVLGERLPDQLLATQGGEPLMTLARPDGPFAEDTGDTEQPSLEFSADGKYLFASTLGNAAIYDAANGAALTFELAGSGTAPIVTAARFSPIVGGPAVVDFADGTRALIRLPGTVSDTVRVTEDVRYWNGDGPLLVNGQLLDNGIGRHAQLRDGRSAAVLADLGGGWIDSFRYSPGLDPTAAIVTFTGFDPTHDALPEVVFRDGSHFPLSKPIVNFSDSESERVARFSTDASGLAVRYEDGHTELWDLGKIPRKLIDLGLGISVSWLGPSNSRLAAWDRTGRGYLLDMELLRSRPADVDAPYERDLIDRFCGLLGRTGPVQPVPSWLVGRCP